LNSRKCSSFPISNWDHSMTDHVLVVDEFWEILWLAHHFVYVLCGDKTRSRMCICNCLAQQLWYLCWIWKIMIGLKWRLVTLKFTSMAKFKSHTKKKNTCSKYLHKHFHIKCWNVLHYKLLYEQQQKCSFFHLHQNIWCSNSTSKGGFMESNHRIMGKTTKHELLMGKIRFKLMQMLVDTQQKQSLTTHTDLDIRIYTALAWLMMPGLVSSHPHLFTSITVFQNMKFFSIYSLIHKIKTILG